MRPENAEFNALLESSGWNQVEVARRLHRTQAVISRWKNDVDPADRTAIELFKLILASENPAALSPAILHDRTVQTESDAALWRRRAKLAEKKLADLQSDLRSALQRASNSKVSALADSIEESAAQEILGKRPSPAPHKP